MRNADQTQVRKEKLQEMRSTWKEQRSWEGAEDHYQMMECVNQRGWMVCYCFMGGGGWNVRLCFWEPPGGGWDLTASHGGLEGGRGGGLTWLDSLLVLRLCCMDRDSAMSVTGLWSFFRSPLYFTCTVAEQTHYFINQNKFWNSKMGEHAPH